jgi:diguanylate cyclase (GGDEF)-like protein/PAS domain S-box-containing protein
VRPRGGSGPWIESTVKPLVAESSVAESSVAENSVAGSEAERTPTAAMRLAGRVVDVAASPVVVFDPDGLVLRFNAACEQLSGYRADEVVGTPIWHVLIPPDELDGVMARFANLRAGLPADFENHWLCRDGTTRLISWSNTCVTNEDGAVTHVIATGTDIGERQRTDEALRGIAAVGQLLASHGPSPATLDAVLGALADHMGYRHLSLLLVEGDRVRVGAARGLGRLPDTIPIERGIVGRVARTGEAAWVRDVRLDPDYYEANPDVRNEIAVPLFAAGQTVGVLDIEGTPKAPLTDRDLHLAQMVAERIAGALLLGREQQALAERARLLAGLSEFAQATNAILQPDLLVPALMDALAGIFPGDVMTLTILDRASGRYILQAERGLNLSVVGAEVRPGDGPAGRAIEARAFIGPVTLEREGYWSQVRDLIPLDALVSVTVPLVRDELVLGAISIGRASLDHPFSDVECEVMKLLGSQAALALANADLHQEVSELAIHDGLTGLYNRRHFDAALDLIFARWRRNRGTTTLAAIMFDLDHFGRFNKQYGHQAGDAVLRSFAGLLRERLRSSDLVARYGGEEFVVILEECGLVEAVRLAEEVRAGLEQRVIIGPLGASLKAMVSAGCAELDPAEPTREALLRAADVALSMAKRSGRNRVEAA